MRKETFRKLNLSILGLLAFMGVGCSASPRMPDEDVRAKISDHTARFADSAVMSQVEYFAPDGISYLWFPGNIGIVKARWKVEGSKVCFNYQANSRSYYDGSPGGQWECNPSGWWITRRVAEKVQGDVFDLSTRPVVPFDLTHKIGFWDLSPPPAPDLAELASRYQAMRQQSPGSGFVDSNKRDKGL